MTNAEQQRPRGRLVTTLATTVMALAVALVALALLASEEAEAAGKFKTVTKTFVQPAEIAIPGNGGGAVGPADPYPATKNIPLSAFPKGAKIVDVDLALRGFSHTGPAEVDFMLVHAGVNRTVMSDAGGGLDAENLLITLDDQAQAQLPSGFLNPLANGRFRPANFDGIDDPNDTVDDSFPAPAPAQNAASALSGFRGKNPEGAWRLFAVDQFNAGAGELSDGYSLKIRAKFEK